VINKSHNMEVLKKMSAPKKLNVAYINGNNKDCI
jgi:hypothetical protein